MPRFFEEIHPSLAAHIDAGRDEVPWAAPGAVWNYSNAGYAVVGRALEVAGGRPFATLVETHVTGPSGMTATMDPRLVAAEDHVLGHMGSAAAVTELVRPSEPAFSESYGPMGGLWGSGRDLAAWAEALIEDPGALGLGEPHTRTLYPDTHYGYGAFINGESPRVIRHGGSFPGFETAFEVVPDEGFGVGVAVNAAWYDPGELVALIREGFDIPIDDAHDGWSHGPEAEALFAGTYDGSGDLGRVVVVRRDGGLYAQIGAASEARLTHYGGDTYGMIVAGQDTDIVFWRDSADAPATHVVSNRGVGERM